MTSFKNLMDFTTHPLGFPQTWVFSNYLTAFEFFYVQLDARTYVYVEMMAVYSVLYAGGCAFVQTLAACIEAYATARFVSVCPKSSTVSCWSPWFCPSSATCRPKSR